MRIHLRSILELGGDLVRAIRAQSVAAAAEPCWCGRRHRAGEWHDPTHGRIDRDIQDHVRRGFPDSDRATRVAIENTLQDRRKAGDDLW